MKTIKNIATIFFVIYIVNIINCHQRPPHFKCVHNIEDEKNTLPNIVIEKSNKEKEDYKRRMDNEVDSQGFKDFHIYIDLLNIKKEIKKYQLSDYEDLLISSMQKAVSTLQSLLKVKPLNKGYQISTDDLNALNISEFNNSMFGDEAISKSISLLDLGIDLVIFGTVQDLDSSTLATASAKKYQIGDGQPYVGLVKINKNVDYSKPNSREYFQATFLHEFTHILGFSKHFFENYSKKINKKVDKNGINRLYLTGTKLLEVAKRYYNCDSLEGVPLENLGGEGTSGSHWEARYLLGEYMNGYSYTEEQVISEFTLAVLEDSGYYKPNYYTGGLMRFGKNKGCQFLEDFCVDKKTHKINEKNENEFYDWIYNPEGIDPSCSSGRQSRTYSAFYNISGTPTEFQYFNNSEMTGYEPADYCPVPISFSDEEEKVHYVGHCSEKGSKTEYGTITPYHQILGSDYRNYIGEVLSERSFCFLSSLSKKEAISRVVRANCYEVYCSEKSLTIKIFKDYIVCPRAGGKIEVEGYEGYVLCPDYNLICTGTEICNDMFSCVEKKSEIKPDSYTYDYESKTSQNIKKSIDQIPENETNYELSDNGICPINCKHCKNHNICIKCRNSYVLKLEEDNNIICESIGKLSSGYYKNENDVYIKCIDNCDLCKDMKTCDKCKDNYYYHEKKCIEKKQNVAMVENCHEYDEENNCIRCLNGYGLKEDNKKTCYDITELIDYYTEDDINYYPCKMINENWTRCYYNKTEYRVKALECVEDKYLIEKGVGLCYTEEEINNNTKYYIINETHAGICSKAIKNCIECVSGTNCTTCKVNNVFDIQKNECKVEKKSEKPVNSGYYSDIQDNDTIPIEEDTTTTTSAKKKKRTIKKSEYEKLLNSGNSIWKISNINIIKTFYLLSLLIL